MKHDVLCPVCGYDRSRDPICLPSLARISKTGALFARPGMEVRPKAEWERLEAELASLREENCRLQKTVRQNEKELERLRQTSGGFPHTPAVQASPLPICPAPSVPAEERFWSLHSDLLLRNSCFQLPEAVTVPSEIGGQPVEKLGSFAIYRQNAVRRVRVSEGIRELGKFSLCENPKLEAVALPASLRKMGDYSFSRDYSLRFMELPEGLEELGEFSFGHCTALQAMHLPSTLRRIGDCAFWNCSSLAEISLPDKLQSLGPVCFHGCTNLRLVTFPRWWEDRREEIEAADIRCEVRFR